MKRRSFCLPVAVAFCAYLWLGIGSTGATVLIFEKAGTNFPSGTEIPASYGDNVSSTVDAEDFKYEVGNGFTPDVVVDYDVSDSDSEPFRVYQGGFGDLGFALGAESTDLLGEIVLRPAAGFRVQLNSFDIAAWNNSDATGQIEVFNELGSAEPVVTYSGTFAQNDTTGQDDQLGWDTFTPNITSDLAIRIRSPNFGTLGIDNINFDQSVVPEPSMIVLWSIAALVCGYLVARKRGASPFLRLGG